MVLRMVLGRIGRRVKRVLKSELDIAFPPLPIKESVLLGEIQKMKKGCVTESVPEEIKVSIGRCSFF